MDISILQNYIPHFVFIGAILLSWAAWSLLMIAVNRHGQKLNVLHIKKMAGNASAKELEFLKNSKVPFLYKMKKYKKRYPYKKSWKDKFHDYKIKFNDWLDGLKQYNPFFVIRQLEQMQTDYKTLKRDYRGFQRVIGKQVQEIDSRFPKPEPSKPVEREPVGRVLPAPKVTKKPMKSQSITDCRATRNKESSLFE